MRVLLVHNSDGGWGGGQIAMMCLQSNLRSAGIDARILCGSKIREDSITIPRWSRLESLIGRITCRAGLNNVHCVSSFRVKNMEAYRTADVIDFHCIHHEFFSYLALPRLTADKPCVFTLHDMWPFTGHCHNSLDCEKWKTGCGTCPYPQVEPAIQRDGTWMEWRLKNWVYQRSRLALVTPSKWLGEQVKESILGHFPTYHIPHGVDTDIYHPLDFRMCREALGIPSGKNVVLFAVDDLKRRLKGTDLLLKAMEMLPDSLKSETVLLLLGKGGDALARMTSLPSHSVGYISSDRLKALCYSAADLLVSPTRADNFPVTLLESLACGTPIVSFRINGVPEIVRPDLTGYLAQPENAQDLAHGICILLEDRSLLAAMRERCRAVALNEYKVQTQTKRYMDLYHEVVRNPVPLSAVALRRMEGSSSPSSCPVETCDKKRIVTR
jgi:glycosyltransferase involved in cell wall biosynthesis